MNETSSEMLLHGGLRGHYRRFLLSALGGAAITSVYSFVDTVAVGFGVGPAGVAATAVLLPSFGVVAFLGTVFGVGGGILLSSARGRGEARLGDGYFTASLLAVVLISLLATAGVLLGGDPVWRLCGSDDALLPLVREYGVIVVTSWPFATLSMYLACMLRNDGAPGQVLLAVISGGVLNAFGDWLLVFPFGMGMAGAAIATAAGTFLQAIILLAYFFRKQCALRLAAPRLWPKGVFRQLFGAGFSAGVPSIALIVLTILLNNQVMRYGGEAALAVYGVAISLSTFFQQIYSGVGQALQPIVSIHFGAGARARIRRTFWLALRTIALLGAIFLGMGCFFPTALTRVFMSPSPEVLAVAPGILRGVSISFLPMGFIILACYYLQSLMRTRLSCALSLSRGVVVSGILLVALPPVMGLSGTWWALIIAEYATALWAGVSLFRMRGQECERFVPYLQEILARNHEA